MKTAFWSFSFFFVNAAFALAASAVNAAPGVGFAETLSGRIGGHGPQLTLKIQVATDGVQTWKNDPQHIVQVKGTADLAGWSFPVAGTMGLLEPARSTDAPGRYLRYELQSVGSKIPYAIECAKHVQDGMKQNIIGAMTICPGSLRVAGGAPQSVVLLFDWKNPVVMEKFLASFHAIHASNPAEAAKAESIFFETIMANIWDTISKKGDFVEFPGNTFHWLPLGAAGDWMGLELVRNQDTGDLAFRTFFLPSDGSPIRSWIRETSTNEPSR